MTNGVRSQYYSNAEANAEGGLHLAKLFLKRQALPWSDPCVSSIEFAGAVYHVTSRGDGREPISQDDTDRAVFLGIVSQALKRFDAQAWAYCLMGNHYHLLLHTRKANLCRLMRQINGVYTQASTAATA